MATVTSSDNVVTAVTDDANGGVLVRIRPGAGTVRAIRIDVATGARTPVRSGDPVTIISGEGHAYDHEVIPGRASKYVAEVSGVDSQGATVTLAWRALGSWLRSPLHPSLSTPVRVIHPIDLTEEAATQVLYPDQSRFPWARGGALRAPSGTYTFRTISETEGRAVRDLIRSGGPLHLSAVPESGHDPQWIEVVAMRTTRPGETPGWVLRDFTVSFVEVDRPYHVGAPVLMPSWGWTQAVGPYSTMAGVQAAYGSVWAMMLAGIGA